MHKMRKKLTNLALILAFLLVFASIPAVAVENGTPADFLDLMPSVDDNEPTDLYDLIPTANENTSPGLIDFTPAFDNDRLNDSYGNMPVYTDTLYVALPVSLDFIIDPFELAGRGQVYSEPYEFINYGSADVILTITDVSVIFANDSDFEAVAYPFGNEYVSEKKAICLLMNFGKLPLPSVPITDEDWTPIALDLRSAGNEYDSFAFSISGTINPFPEIEWCKGDVRIRLTYLIEPIVPFEDGEEFAEESEELQTPVLYDASEITEPHKSVPVPAIIPEALETLVLLDLVIDPLEFSGRGQVYSESFEFTNYNGTGAILTITDVSVIIADDTDFESIVYPFGNEYESENKTIYLMLNFDTLPLPAVPITGEDWVPIALDLEAFGSEYDSLTLSISGTINLPPNIEWRGGDVRIILTYLIEPNISLENDAE